MKYVSVFLMILIFNVPFFMAQEITLEEYPNNPVFDPATRAYYPTVIFDINKFSGHGPSAYYKMWYSDGSGGTYLTQSEDGVNWTNINVNSGLTNSHHCHVVYFPIGFTGINSGLNPSSNVMNYRLWYWDTSQLYSINSIRYAESPNGINWYNDQSIQQVGNSVVSGSWPDWNRGSYGPIDVFYNPSGSNILDDANIWNNKFVMYYDGTTGGVEEIGLAYSTNGILWKGYGRVLERGGGSTWDSDYTSYGTVVKIDDTWHMWYSGSGYSGGANEGIGHATSQDGLNWQRDPNNPIFHKDDGVSWRNSRTYTPSVIYEPNGFETGSCPNLKMWFTGRTGDNYTIGYAYGCISQTSSKKLSPTMFYNVKVVEVFNPTSNIHYIGGGGFTQGAVLTQNVDNIIQIGVQNRGILKAKNVSITVEDSPSCLEVDIKQSKADIFPKSTHYFDITINPKCEKGNYKIIFLVQGNNISQIEEFEFSVG
jgi:hypothetical protein